MVITLVVISHLSHTQAILKMAFLFGTLIDCATYTFIELEVSIRDCFIHC